MNTALHLDHAIRRRAAGPHASDVRWHRMQIQYERDRALRRVTVTLRGEYQASEILALLERHRVEDDWRDGRLYDVRDLTGRPTVGELRMFSRLDTAHRPHGPVAILTDNPILYGLACTYAALGRSTLKIEVFRDADEAAQWLGNQGNEGGDVTP